MALVAVFALFAVVGLFLILAGAAGRRSSVAPSMYRDDIGFIGWVLFLVCALLAGSAYLSFAHAEQWCPPDRPIKKMVATGTITCTARACLGGLHCPVPGEPPPVGVPVGACYRVPDNSCNTCTPQVAELCLSQEEYDEALRK